MDEQCRGGLGESGRQAGGADFDWRGGQGAHVGLLDVVDDMRMNALFETEAKRFSG